MSTFPPELRAERQALGVSTADMAERLGITKAYLTKVERGDRNSSSGRAYMMASEIVERYREILRREKAAGSYGAR